MFYPMEEQASHITRLLEENRRYIREHGKLKKSASSSSPSARRVSQHQQQLLSADNYSSSEYSTSTDYSTDYNNKPSDLQDRVMALQVQNSELNVCLEKERRRRREAEERMERDESYIKRLEDSVQVLRGTRVVMDPSTYRQLAEAYMVGRRTPARRPHTHTPGGHGSDLVCDASQNTPMPPKTVPSGLPHTSSCPSSPKSSSSSSSSSSYDDSQLFTRSSGRSKKERGELGAGGGAGVRGLGAGSSMNPWDYQQLLESLEDLDGANRGALS